MIPSLHWRAGFELELLAPRGSSRRTLADALAEEAGGGVRPVWHEDSEPALVASLGGRFLHLTQGFEVTSATGDLLCTLVDDVTLVADLDPTAAAVPGWHRLLTDDPRLLRLLARHSDPGGPLERALDGAAALWDAVPERHGNIWRLDTAGATIALATPAGGERERPCEIITPPLVDGHREALERLLRPARALGFTVPQEAATHIHFDGAPFHVAPTLANVVRLFSAWREPLHRLFNTNPACRRLSALPQQLVDAAAGTPSIDDLRAAADEGRLTKFFDVNLTQLLRDDPLRDTIEVRILPGTLDADDLIVRAAIVEGLLERCLRPEPIPAPPADPRRADTELRDLATAASLA